MPDKNYYRILQVDPEAEPEVIQSAYRRLAQLYHPDVSQAPNAEQRMRDLNEAWEILRDPAARRKYDEFLASQGSSVGATSRSTTAGGPGQSSQSNANASSQSHEHTTEGPSAGQPRAHSSNGDRAPFPDSCERCHVSDTTLRICAFPYVISVIILTFRRAWSGVYCENCRKAMMTKAKLLTLFFGWWGVPFGPIFSLGVLFSPSQGRIPIEPNSQYLAGLGAHFLRSQRLVEAARAWTLSLAYKDNPQILRAYREVFRGLPDRAIRPEHGRGGGFLFGLSVVLAGVFAYAVLSPSSGPRTIAATSVPTSRATPADPGLTVPEMSSPLIHLQRYNSPSAHLSVRIPASYEAEYELDQDGGQPAHRIVISRDFRTASPDAVVVIYAFQPTQTPVDANPDQLKSLAESVLLRQTAILDSWASRSAVRTTSLSYGARAETAGTYRLQTTEDGAQLFFVWKAVIATRSWVYFIDVLGDPGSQDSTTEHYRLIANSFVPYVG